VNRNGVWLAGKIIPFPEIKSVVYQKINPEKPGLGGWVKIVTEDNLLIP
jgi:hypothetical protein